MDFTIDTEGLVENEFPWNTLSMPQDGQTYLMAQPSVSIDQSGRIHTCSWSLWVYNKENDRYTLLPTVSPDGMPYGS